MPEVSVQRMRRRYSDDPRQRRVSLRLNDEELAVVENAAELACMKLSTFAARAVLAVATNTTPPATGTVNQYRQLGLALLQLTSQLKRIGANLNQAVVQFHLTGDAPDSLTVSVEQLASVLTVVEETTEVLYDKVAGDLS